MTVALVAITTHRAGVDILKDFPSGANYCIHINQYEESVASLELLPFETHFQSTKMNS